MKGWRWLIILAPLLVGAGFAVYFFLVFDLTHDHIVYLRADLGTLSILAGLLFSLLTAAGIGLMTWEEKRRQREQSKAAEERRRFLRRLDHELKNPLTAIQAGIANLAESTTTRIDQKTLSSLKAQAVRMSRLSSDLRKLAEIEVRPVERLQVDTTALLSEAFQMAKDRPEASRRKLTLNLPQAPWPLPTLEGDADLLLLAVHNLLENALKFSSPGDTVELRAIEDGQGVVIEVADTGPGIPEEDRPHVWEELYRGNSNHGIPGSGLGLALVRAIIERHRGTFGLRSRLDEGTVFTLRLPIH